jgi:hypothetical protein
MVDDARRRNPVGLRAVGQETEGVGPSHDAVARLCRRCRPQCGASMLVRGGEQEGGGGSRSDSLAAEDEPERAAWVASGGM